MTDEQIGRALKRAGEDGWKATGHSTLSRQIESGVKVCAPTMAVAEAYADSSCGCAKRPDGLRDRCAAGQRLWEELIEARDALDENRRSGSRVERKATIDEFAARRDAYHAHLSGEVA